VSYTKRRLDKAKRFWGKYWVCVLGVGVRVGKLSFVWKQTRG